jgi:hypothetical protein
MRSSKSRSRSKQNRPRTLGNIINRVFDSSGPEGKVRGTPQQIIEKYQLLARDAQLSNDRVAAENFLQHAEHYTRLLAEAQREMAAEQESRQLYQQQNQNGNSNGQSNGNRDRQPGEREYRNDPPRADDYSDDQPYPTPAAGFDVVGEGDAGLVDLPEFARPPRREPAQERPRDDRQRDERPRSDRNERPRNDNNRPKPAQDRPREDRRAEPRFAEQPAAIESVEVQAAVPAVEVPAPKPAPKPRVRKPVVKPDAPKTEE